MFAAGLAAIPGGAGCGGGGGPERAGGLEPNDAGIESAEEGEPSAQDESAAEAAGTLVSTLIIATPRVPDDLDPLGGLEPMAARVVDDAVFEGLVAPMDTGWPWVAPALADACVVVPADAPRDVYCHLRPDRVFHDGTPVTVDDVEYSLEFWMDPRRGWLRDRHGLSTLKRVERVDGPPRRADAERVDGFGDAARDPGRWFRVSFSDPHPLALETIAGMKVVPKKAHRGRRRAFARAPIGSGPMRVETLESERLVLQAVAADNRADDAAADGGVTRIVLRQVDDGAEVLTLMRRGDVHIATELSRTHVPEELAEAGMSARFNAWLVSPPRYDLVIYNLRSGVQSGPRLRAALDDGIPRAEIAGILGGTPPLALAAPVDLHDPSPIDLALVAEAGRAARWGTAGLVEDTAAADDVRGAERLAAELNALGWEAERGVRRRDATTLRVVLMWNGAAGHGRKVAASLKAAWRGQGVTVPYATASWSYLRGPLRRGEFDMALARVAQADDADLYPYFHSRGALNISGIADAQLDAALVAYRRARTPEERAQTERAVAERIAVVRPVSVLHAPTAISLVSRRVVGLRFVDDLPALSTSMRLLPHDQWRLSQR